MFINLISKFIRAEAFPGPCNVFTLALPCAVRWPALLELFCEYGLVLKMISGDFQLTHLGLAKIRWTRELDSWNVMFQRRSIAILDMSAWELVDRLEEHGWRMSVLQLRRQPKDIDLTQALVLPYNNFHINGRNLSLGHSYLAVLNLTKGLAKRGTHFFKFELVFCMDKMNLEQASLQSSTVNHLLIMTLCWAVIRKSHMI